MGKEKSAKTGGKCLPFPAFASRKYRLSDILWCGPVCNKIRFCLFLYLLLRNSGRLVCVRVTPIVFLVVADLMNTGNLWSSNAHFVFLSKRKNFTKLPSNGQTIDLERNIFVRQLAISSENPPPPPFILKTTNLYSTYASRVPPRTPLPTNTFCLVSFFILAKGRPPPPPTHTHTLPVRVHIPFLNYCMVFCRKQDERVKSRYKTASTIQDGCHSRLRQCRTFCTPLSCLHDPGGSPSVHVQHMSRLIARVTTDI